jgi:crotonobetainyl-CoA:carnitine CoA-transferase CaiB-like acyl-CoA transferase
MAKKPLAHFKILDLSRILAGPLATQLLADFGAEVFKIEPLTGDPTRGWGPPFELGDMGESAFFRCANRGKQSLAMDLADPEAQVTLDQLLKTADVLVENFLPDTAERLGITWERLHGKYPKLILASVRGYASDVPASRRPGYDFIIQAESGWMSINGEPEGRPMRVGSALVDVLAGLYLANGIQAALLHRERCGEPLHVEVPLMEAALAGLVNVGSGALMTGESPRRMGNAHPHLVPFQTFPSLEGEVAVGVGSDRQFEILALWAGLDLDQEPHWRTNQGRVQDRDRLVPILEAHFRALHLAEIIEFCEIHAIPASPVRSVADVLFSEAGRSHHLIATLYDEAAGCMVPVLGTPVLLNEERVCSKIPPPRWQG